MKRLALLFVPVLIFLLAPAPISIYAHPSVARNSERRLNHLKRDWGGIVKRPLIAAAPLVVLAAFVAQRYIGAQ
ncbi:MAG: hypothetical protein ABSB96_00235 [Gaiellaceae bacterium]